MATSARMVARKKNARFSQVPAKIAAPRLAEIYKRSALFRTLDAARKKRAVWICAPAGAGKTSVATTYLAERKLPTLWYNVDGRDGDVANVFHYLAVAAKLAAGRRRITLPAFAIEHQTGVAAFARNFFTELYRQRPSPSALVLDDYQDAHSALLDEVLREALTALPEGISVIVVSRAEPPPLLARHVASGAIAIVGTDELRLTHRDTTGMIRVYRPDLTGTRLKNVLPRILELTNGWAAALALLLQTRRDVGIDVVGIEQFSGRLFDYFATEVLDKATPREREFLLKTSVVPSLSGPLAARLTGNPDSERALAELGRRSFLTQQLGTSGSYRYHPLLRAFLLRRAEADLGAAAVQELHRRAAEAFIETDQIDEAMEQFETAGEVGLRTSLLLSVAPSYMAKGRSRTIEAWIARLPAEWVANHGWLLYWQGVSCMGYANARAPALFELAYAHLARDQDIAGIYLCCGAALQAVVHEGRDFSLVDVWIGRLEALERSEVRCPPQFEPMVALGMAMASVMRVMDVSHHHRWTKRAQQLAETSPDPGHRVLTRAFIAMYYAFFVDNFEAAMAVEMLRASARAEDGSTIGELSVMQADALCLWARGDNGPCLTLVRDALSLAARSGVFTLNNFVEGVGVAAALGLGDVAAARSFLASLAKAAHERGGWQEGFYYFNAGWEALVRGESALALGCAEKAQHSAETVGPPFGRMVAPFAVAQALFALNRKDEALASLAKSMQLSRALGSALVLHGCLLVESDCLWEEDGPRALASLREGLELARRHGYYNMYWLSTAIMTRIAIRALEHEIETEHVHATIARRQLVPDTPPVHLENWPWNVRLYALGSFVATREIDPTDVVKGTWPAPERALATTGKPRELLQALIAFGGRGVRESVLTDALWPQAEGDAARRVFDTTLHRLRRQLGDDRVVRLNDGYVYLDERQCWVDVFALDHVLVQTERETEEGAVADPARVARRLLAIYRGPLLAELDISVGWVARPREQLQSKFIRLVERLGLALEHRGAVRDAIVLYERAQERAPRAEALRDALARCTRSGARRVDEKPDEDRTV
jgi:LuxR family maltose regulon positive regulatory protein